MGSGDQKHFECYREQTRVKHEILRKYIPPFFSILKGGQENLLYIDAFAGRGTYDDTISGKEVPGSPLHALNTISNHHELSKKVTSIFIEEDKGIFLQLKVAIDRFYENNCHIRKPVLYNQSFSQCISDFLDELDRSNERIAPSFLFVDPCGITGTSFKEISRFMSNDKCEAFIFFNIDGLRRVCGLKNPYKTLTELYGSKQRATRLLKGLEGVESAQEREKVMLCEYIDGMKEEIGESAYTIAFAVEQESRRITSHYLIHVTKHDLGFSIMKDVMWKLGSSEEREGSLGLVQASKYEGTPLFRPKWDSFKQSILDKIQDKSLPVKLFYKDMVKQPENKFSESAYREALLELEDQGQVRIIDKDRETPKPASKRKRSQGKPTLGKDYFVELI